MTLAALRHPDAEVRRQCIAGLEGPAVDREQLALLDLLDDPDWRVRREVALAISRATDVSASVAPLIDAVERGDVARRNAAMEALRQIGSSVAPVVLGRLNLVNTAARRFLVELLADVGDATAVPALEALLEGDDANVAHAAAESLARIHSPSAEAALVRALDSAEAVVRLAVLQAFAARRRTLQWDRLEPLLSDPICRRAALLAAASSPEPAALDAILRALAGGGPLASSAAVALGQRLEHGADVATVEKLRAAPRALAALEEIADHGASADARRAAIRCLALAPTSEAIAVVLAAIDQPETSAVAEGALESFGQDALANALACAPALGRNGALSLLRWATPKAGSAEASALVSLAERWLDGGTRSVALWDTVAALGDLAAAERLAERVRSRALVLDPHDVSASLGVLLQRFPSVGEALSAIPVGTPLGVTIAAALARAGLPVDESSLNAALSAPDPALRAGALRALAALDPRGTVDTLVFALADEDASVQTAAAEALGARGEGREMLIASLGASDPRVRRAALSAVSRWSDGADRIRPLLEDGEPSVILGAMDALGAALTGDELVALTAHPDADVASEALANLRAKDRTRAAHVADRLLAHPVWSVRLEAVRALVDAGPSARARLAVARDAERDELVVEAIDAALSSGGPPR